MAGGYQGVVRGEASDGRFAGASCDWVVPIEGRVEGGHLSIDRRDDDVAEDEAAFGKKLATLEEKLHNPKAKVVYDVFATKPGAMLYSQLTWLLGNVIDGDGEPTKAQLELESGLSTTRPG